MSFTIHELWLDMSVKSEEDSSSGSAPEVLLDKEEIGRYGRQLILPEWGVQGETATSSKLTSKLVV